MLEISQRPCGWNEASRKTGEGRRREEPAVLIGLERGTASSRLQIYVNLKDL